MTKSEEQFIKEHGAFGKALISLYGLKHAIETLEYRYMGEYDSEEDFAKSYTRQRADEIFRQESVEHRILYHFCNWEHVAMEFFFNHFKSIEVGDKIHVLKLGKLHNGRVIND